MSLQGLALGKATHPANKAKISLTINSAPHPVVKMSGTESLSEGFRFELDILADKLSPLHAYIGSNSQISFIGQDGINRNVLGMVTHIIETGSYDDTMMRATVTIESVLSKLRYQRDTRIILGHNVPDIIRLTCDRHGLTKEQVRFDLNQVYPIRPYTLQANETDWDFVVRLASNAGMYFYHSEQNDQELVVFTDHNAQCPYIARSVLNYIAPSGQPTNIQGDALVGLYHVSANARRQVPQVRIHDFNEETPANSLLANAQRETLNQTSQTPAPGETLFGLGSRTIDESDTVARRHIERANVLAFDLVAQGNVVDMAAGHICMIDATEFHDKYSGDYMITSVTHEAAQHSGANLTDEDIAYRHRAVVIRRETPFRPAPVAHPEVPMTLTARIESDGPYARLDDQGKYLLRTLFDLSSTQHTQASIPMRRLSPYGGPPNQSNVGWHTPLQDGDEVLISCLNGDPDRPMIVGTLPNPERSSPVTNANPSQNRLRTQNDNELTFDDTKEKEAVTLRTHDAYNILHLDAASVGHKIRLATEHGAMSIWAKKTMHRQSDDTMTERVGNNRNVIVENKHKTETSNGEIHHQANTDHRHSAYKNIKTQSGENTELQTGRHMIMDIDNNAKLTIKGSGGLFAEVRSSDLFIQCANSINIKGQGGGDITFEQSGGGFKVDAGGNVSLYGKSVYLGGSGGVSLNGKVNYSVPGPQPPGPVSTQAPLLFAGIQLLKDPNGPQATDAAWVSDRVPVGEPVEGMFMTKNVPSGSQATISIYEFDSDGQKDLVDTLTVTIKGDGTGHNIFIWDLSEEQVAEDTEDDEVAGDTGPLDYRFEVSISDSTSEMSPHLYLTKTIIIQTEQDGDDEPLPEGARLTLCAADGRKHHSIIEQSCATFTDVVVGPCDLEYL